MIHNYSEFIHGYVVIIEEIEGMVMTILQSGVQKGVIKCVDPETNSERDEKECGKKPSWEESVAKVNECN